MKKTIYGISVFVMFATLIMGIDDYFGPEVKRFSTVIFFIWAVQTVNENWEKIKEITKILSGFDKK